MRDTQSTESIQRSIDYTKKNLMKLRIQLATMSKLEHKKT